MLNALANTKDIAWRFTQPCANFVPFVGVLYQSSRKMGT